MKTHKILWSFLAILLLGLFFTPASFAGEGCDDSGEMEEMCKLLQEWAKKTIGNPEFVGDCLGFAEDPALCDAADAPGGGLVCPEPPEATTNNHDCQMFNAGGFEAAFGDKATEILKIAGKFTVRFVMIGEEKSIPSHNHQQTCDGSGSCANEYIKRQEKVTVFFAAAQEGKISASAPLGSFGELDTYKASFGSEKVTYFQVSNQHYCTKVEHGDPRSCRKPPTTPGGCTGEHCDQTSDEAGECDDVISEDQEPVIFEH